MTLPVLLDVNVWLALVLSKHVHHDAARRWFEGVDNRDAILFCRVTQQAFLRLLTNAAVLAPYGNLPLSDSEAWSVFDRLAADPRIALRVDEPVGTAGLWRELTERDTSSTKLWMDAYLAAFAIAADHGLVTTDGAFQQFSALDLVVIA